MCCRRMYRLVLQLFCETSLQLQEPSARAQSPAHLFFAAERTLAWLALAAVVLISMQHTEVMAHRVVAEICQSENQTMCSDGQQ